MRGSYMVRTIWIITCKMSTAIAYSFMTMDRQQSRNDIRAGSRRCSSNSEKYMNAGYDNGSESGILTRSGKRRPRKRSSSSSRTKKDPRVCIPYLQSISLSYTNYTIAVVTEVFLHEAYRVESLPNQFLETNSPELSHVLYEMDKIKETIKASSTWIFTHFSNEVVYGL